MSSFKRSVHLTRVGQGKRKVGVPREVDPRLFIKCAFLVSERSESHQTHVHSTKKKGGWRLLRGKRGGWLEDRHEKNNTNFTPDQDPGTKKEKQCFGRNRS